ncbi:putative phosphoglycerate mutase [Cytobacillus eiseniae]|uniref:Phosphoglycerate mutase n=1 Tax=Cytobacillus eiseniae TaxID=762947 RepID=A0ABS4RHN3_9BACI|nr:histidine phosphatase family protein [Cytobacillus eiseniae]MBP2242407.1 putative phosphoglycerate mutase [Cytobacillus eiseniae]
MLNLYFIRHGETEWNTEKRMQGRFDSELTDKGKKDAMRLSERLKDTTFERIISSPSQRAVDTADLVRGKRPIPIETDERLMEIALGAWQGKTEDEIKALFPVQYDLYWHHPSMYENLEGERFIDVMDRVESFLEGLIDSTPSGNVLVVTHGVVLKTLYLICRNTVIDQLWDPPFMHGTSLTIVKFHDGEKELLLEGCMAHCQ